jgi:hypothetical protein
LTVDRGAYGGVCTALDARKQSSPALPFIRLRRRFDPTGHDRAAQGFYQQLWRCRVLLNRDEDYTVSQFGFYMRRPELRIPSALNLLAGVRRSSVSFDSTTISFLERTATTAVQ